MRRNPAPLAILATALAASLAPVPGTSARAEDGLPPAPVTLEAPSAVGGLVVEDGDGDGIPDVFVVEGREVRGFRGVRGAGPAAAPTWTFTVPPDATFVDVAGPVGDGAERTASCLALASGGVVRLVPGRPRPAKRGSRRSPRTSPRDCRPARAGRSSPTSSAGGASFSRRRTASRGSRTESGRDRGR